MPGSLENTLGEAETLDFIKFQPFNILCADTEGTEARLSQGKAEWLGWGKTATLPMERQSLLLKE